MKDRSCAVAAVLRVIVPVLSLVAVSSEDPPPALASLVRLKGESMAAYAQREATRNLHSRTAFLSDLAVGRGSRRRAFVLDVGANVGAWSDSIMSAARAAAPTAAVSLHIMEPAMPRLGSKLRRVAQRWEAVLVPGAAWTSEGNITLHEVKDSRATSLVALRGARSSKVRSVDLADGADCLRKFRSNRDVGALVFAALVAGKLLGAPPGA